MSLFENLRNNDEAKILISIIWGLGFATLFRKACKGRNCIVINGPKPSEMENKIYRFDNKCYKYKAINTKCKKNK